MIAVGGSIGTGLFVGSGSALLRGLFDPVHALFQQLMYHRRRPCWSPRRLVDYCSHVDQCYPRLISTLHTD